MKKAVIFDMDGVLVDSEPLHYESDKKVMQSMGVNVKDDYFDRFVGQTNPEMWKIIKDEFKIVKDTESILEEQNRMKIELLETISLKPIKGITEIMDELQVRNIPAAVASSSSAVFISAVLKKTGLESCVRCWISGEEVPNGKPEPDIFLKAAGLLNTAPSDCVVIEDSRHGVTAAKKAEMKCIGYRNPNSGNQNLSGADIIISSFEILNIDIMLQ